MCLTGVDYFSTLAYQPSIAFVAAGALSPLATFVLVALTLLGAFPMYSRVADLSPYGQGSILILEKLFPKWKGKAVVLCLLGFAATGFVITITLSAADATAHLIQNPLAPAWLNHPIVVTIVLLLVLGGVFMKGFGEAITLAVAIVIAYMTLNGIVIVAALREIWRHAEVLANWKAMLVTEHGHPVVMVAMALLLFPKLALGLSGFETGVAVMPLVRGDAADTEAGVEEERAPGAQDEVGDHLLELIGFGDREHAVAGLVDDEPVLPHIDARQARVAGPREEVAPARRGIRFPGHQQQAGGHQERRRLRRGSPRRRPFRAGTSGSGARCPTGPAPAVPARRARRPAPR